MISTIASSPSPRTTAPTAWLASIASGMASAWTPPHTTTQSGTVCLASRAIRCAGIAMLVRTEMPTNRGFAARILATTSASSSRSACTSRTWTVYPHASTHAAIDKMPSGGKQF